MKTLSLIMSTLALGAMMGITGTHFQQVKAMAGNGVQAEVLTIDAILSALPAQKLKPEPVTQPVTLASIEKPAQSRQETEVSLAQRESALMEILVAIRKDQKNLRDQVADANRNMDELTFRVDSHSTQFRPMKIQSSRPRALIIPEENSALNQLLPPKP